MAETLQPALPEQPWAAFAALDWGDQSHAWCLRPEGSPHSEAGKIENTPEAVDAWAAQLLQRFGGRPVAVCLEQKRGALVYMLIKYAHLVLFPLHPTTAARYRQTFAPSGAKNDQRDACSLLDLLLHHREHLQPLQLDTVETRSIQFLAEERRRLVDSRTAHSNRLRAHLKLYFPQLPGWFDNLSTTLVGDLLRRWPTLQQLQRVHPGTLRRFFHQHNCRSAERIEERITAIHAAMPATSDQAVLRACPRIVHGLIEMLETLRRNIEDLDRELGELLAAHPDGFLFQSLPGAGAVLAPRLIAAFGTRRERFMTAYEVQCQSGIAPVTSASGRNQQVHFRWACPKFVRQTFHEFAEQSITHSQWARAFYDHQRQEKHKDHQSAVRSLAFKWIRIIYRCWKDSEPYDEEIYLHSLRRRGSLLGAASAINNVAHWQQVAGFQKFSAINP